MSDRPDREAAAIGLRWLGDRLDTPWRVVIAALAAIIIVGLGLGRVVKDPSVDAFVAQDHPAALAREISVDVFGLEDPIVIGLSREDGGTAFTPETLTALRAITAELRSVPGVKKNDIVSLATENAISGSDGDLRVDPILPDGEIGQREAKEAWARTQSMPMLLDLLASRDGRMVTLLVPVEDPDHAGDPVLAATEIAERLAPDGVKVSIAGVAAMNAHLGLVVDRDTKKLVPLCILAVLLMVLVALRQFRAVLGPLLVILGTVAITVGLMGWLGAKYYLITTSLPIVMMAIAVADSLHLSTVYLRQRRLDAQADARTAMRRALAHTVLPITLTSITTIAGLIGLGIGAGMRPIGEFGLFAAAGVAAAWALSLTLLPAIIILTDLKPRSIRPGREERPRRIDGVLGAITALGRRAPAGLLAPVAIIVSMLAIAAAQAEFDYERKRYFAADAPVRLADAELNRSLGGVNFLDVIVEAPEGTSLMTPVALSAIADLKSTIEADALVSQATAINDYISLMHEVLLDAEPGSLPTRERAPSQYMLLYEASGAPEDFRQEIDYDYRRALIRAQLVTDQFQPTRRVIDRLQAEIGGWNAETGLTATLTGRVAVNAGWMERLEASHFLGLGLAGLLVFLAAIACFRALVPALICMVPVLVGVLSVYGVMGLFAIDIAPATSMAAAICTGLGVDFGIHLVAHVRRKLAEGASLSEATGQGYITVVRACFYSGAGLAIGLSVLLLSSAPPLLWFGALVASGSLGSLLAAVIILPPLFHLLERQTVRSAIHA
jgi:uncharacterized protein